MRQKVIVGMSGGVDSAVAALLLKEMGYDVTGVFMKNWSEEDEFGQCTSMQDFEDAREVCETIGIPCYSVNFEQEYYDRVFSYFLSEYKAGRTPNPDVLCNAEIKFRAFLEFAVKCGGERLATGHYARLHHTDGLAVLQKGVDGNKDQSYFLCMLTQEQLKNALFPLGDLCKDQVRVLAEKNGLFTVAKKKDSTGICFIGERNFRKFLQNYLPAQRGAMVTKDGAVVGEHMGLMYYTLGQRRGLDIGGEGGRWFVAAKDMEHNRLIVTQDETDLFSSACHCIHFNFMRSVPQAFTCCAKFRYRQSDQRVQVSLADTGAHILFEEKQRAVTPGQYAVLYDGDVCLGGGVIDVVYT